MELDWKNLSFKYLPTKGYIQSDYANGAWSAPVIKTEPLLPVHIAASAIHYGQSCFEGLKAFKTKAGKTVIFRPDENAKRMQTSADRICMEAPSLELFTQMCRMAVQENLEYVPPHGTGASLYLRPVLFGTEATIGLKPSDTYTFIVLVTPVGPYYKDGFKPVNALVVNGFDRAAPQGTGRAKVAGNYAAGMKASILAKEKGYPINLFLDSKENRFVDEFGTSNFIGITEKGEYKTPSSASILPSITNLSLQVLAKDIGLTVSKEPISIDALGQFAEVGACGTAAVITPIYSVTWNDTVYTFGDKDKAGNTLTKLFQMLQGIQYGEIADKHNWLVEC